MYTLFRTQLTIAKNLYSTLTGNTLKVLELSEDEPCLSFLSKHILTAEFYCFIRGLTAFSAHAPQIIKPYYIIDLYRASYTVRMTS